LFFISSLQTGFGAHPFYYSMGKTGFFLTVKRQGSKNDHSPATCAEFKNEWSCTSISFDVMACENYQTHKKLIKTSAGPETHGVEFNVCVWS
jgi:hypothetical protein